MSNLNSPYEGETIEQQAYNMAKMLAEWAKNPTTNEFYIADNGPSVAIKHTVTGRVVYSASVIYFSSLARIDTYHVDSVVFYTLIQYCKHKVFK